MGRKSHRKAQPPGKGSHAGLEESPPRYSRRDPAAVSRRASPKAIIARCAGVQIELLVHFAAIGAGSRLGPLGVPSIYLA